MASAKFCGNCGTPSSGAFCTNCGHPMEATMVPQASETGQAPTRSTLTPVGTTGPEAPSDPVPPPPTFSSLSRDEPAQQTGRAATTTPNTARVASSLDFSAISPGDIARDVGALFLLFGALALRWDFANDAADRWWVVLSTLVAVLGLGAPYLGASRLVPGWGPPQVRFAKQLLVAPYVISVLVALVTEFVAVTDDTEGGMGPAVAMGLAGAMLVVSPRTYDDSPGRDEQRWWTVARALITVGLAAMTVSWVVWELRTLLDLVDANMFLATILSVIAQIFSITTVWLMVAVPVLGLLRRRSAAWSRVLQVVAFTIVGVNVMSQNNDGSGAFASTAIEKLGQPLFGFFLVIGGAAALASRPVARALRPNDQIGGWVRTAAYALLLSALGLGIGVAVDVLRMIDNEDYSANLIVPVVLALVAAVAGVLAMSLLLRSADESRLLVLCVLAGIVVAGIIALAVRNSDSFAPQVDAPRIIFWFTLPALAAYALLVPAPVRSNFKPLTPQQPS